MEDEAWTTYCSSPGTFTMNQLGGWGHCCGGARNGSPPTTPASSFGYKFSICGAFRYRKQYQHFSDTTPIHPSHLGHWKIKLTSIFAGTEPCELFPCPGSTLLFHCIDWYFVDWSYSKTYDSSPVMIHSRSIRSTTQLFKDVSAMKTRSSFCSGIKALSALNTPSSSPNSAVEFYVCILVHKILILSVTSQ